MNRIGLYESYTDNDESIILALPRQILQSKELIYIHLFLLMF